MGADFELPDAYESVSDVIHKGRIYCPWNEWGEAAMAHEEYGIQMQAYLQGQSLDYTLRNVDFKVNSLLLKSKKAFLK